MKRYHDLLAYPVMYFIVYMLLGIINWNKDPETWSYSARVIWIIWGTAWAIALQLRLKKEHHEVLTIPAA